MRDADCKGVLCLQDMNRGDVRWNSLYAEMKKKRRKIFFYGIVYFFTRF